MIDDESVSIDTIFEKEIGINMDYATAILFGKGISIEDMEKITSDTKDILTDEIEKANIPIDYRFLLANVILCKLFKTAVAFHKNYVKIRSPEYLCIKGLDISFIKEK